MSKDCSYNELYPLQVLDDSMEPEFPAKCLIVIEPSDVCATGAFVVAEAKGERWFRQYISEGDSRKRLVALNTEYPDIELNEGEYKIIGIILQCNVGRKIKHYHPYIPGGIPPKPIELN
ncbi:MAG: S24 family peptidase [Candidatus Thiodiazotropha sp. (ex Lucinoma aequizonata)]|nr:S24 family peptidase [Candidatus Thiodiazotropha sp. (ex Lucinoma aequizonata)]MCU7889052.1 S24 family peptidase [Candidatus Thiodiazotropha sp. (ex Lucinoma aequizonata)]MCU7896218.1 S24 family peptidase [Candidatus Thiodiazotropha sp. (ex Lucinoma aequizonata)]MCU7900579.1 S24 family peptidase [Candidatus Thiodiazotropha sp. (ex Lucinoma aequizonata)]MCU7901047.1 S24 family peptidase [Candidatus Thiodiazotropha sp. (ex Lucinoma aequizonata)]